MVVLSYYLDSYLKNYFCEMLIFILYFNAICSMKSSVKQLDKFKQNGICHKQVSQMFSYKHNVSHLFVDRM